MKAKIAVGKISVSKKAYLGRLDTFCREFCRETLRVGLFHPSVQLIIGFFAFRLSDTFASRLFLTCAFGFEGERIRSTFFTL